VKQAQVDSPTFVVVWLLYGTAAKSPLNEGNSSLVHVRLSLSQTGPKIWRF